jgi:hypothetical protein
VFTIVLSILAFAAVQLTRSRQHHGPTASLPTGFQIPQVTIPQALATVCSEAIAWVLNFWNGACDA